MICISTDESLIKVGRQGLTKIEINHRQQLEKFLKKVNIKLSDYTFANNYMWFENADGYYKIINGNLCMFINNGALTMLLPPLGGEKQEETMHECFRIMNEFNGDYHSSKIDYVYDGYIDNIDFGIYEVERQNPDYIYLAKEITELKGNKYKTKRNENNYFIKNYKFNYEPYSCVHRDAAMELLYRWAAKRLETITTHSVDHFVELMDLERKAITRVLDQYKELDLKGAVVIIDGKIEGITFGEKINDNTASILIEKTNYEYFGISQFLFRQFCESAFGDCEFMNVGDDLGFENLRKVKMSYHPYAYGPKYTIRQKYAIN